MRLLSNEGLSQNVLRGLKDELTDAYPESRIILEDQALPPPPTSCLNRGRGQYNSTSLLQHLYHKIEKKGDERVLAVESVDLYARNLNFVFGEADPGTGIAVVSTLRLRPEFHGEATSPALFLSRLVKESLHELGHTLGLAHSPDPPAS